MKIKNGMFAGNDFTNILYLYRNDKRFRYLYFCKPTIERPEGFFICTINKFKNNFNTLCHEK